MIMNEQTWNFVRQHRDEDVRKVALQKVKDQKIDLPLALQQIAGWQTARRKLPSWAAVEGILYPPHLNMEQCSSEQTARYKQRLVERLRSEMGDEDASDSDEMDCFVDLTGGLGVDFYWMSQGFKQRCYAEKNAELCALAEYNFHQLSLDARVVCGSAADILPTLDPADIIFLDPARRNEHGGRSYGIADCTPNVLELLPQLLKKAHFIVIKLSPMLDWRKAVSDLKYVQEVHVVSVNNECKELLLVISSEQKDSIKLCCVNDDTVFELSVRTIRTASPDYSDCPSGLFGLGSERCQAAEAHYLYEPNASIMKAGCFQEVAAQYHVQQISANSHLFVSSVEIDDFPGRRFQISAISSMNKQELKETLQGVEKANIAVRNFPLSVEQLRKKLKIKDGRDTYLFATTLADGQHKLFICRKIG